MIYQFIFILLNIKLPKIDIKIIIIVIITDKN